jgi:hypothetical protein
MHNWFYYIMISLHVSTILGHHQGSTCSECQKLEVKICIEYFLVYAYSVRASVELYVCSGVKITRPEIKLQYDEYEYYKCNVVLVPCVYIGESKHVG